MTDHPTYTLAQARACVMGATLAVMSLRRLAGSDKITISLDMLQAAISTLGSVVGWNDLSDEEQVAYGSLLVNLRIGERQPFREYTGDDGTRGLVLRAKSALDIQALVTSFVTIIASYGADVPITAVAVGETIPGDLGQATGDMLTEIRFIEPS